MCCCIDQITKDLRHECGDPNAALDTAVWGGAPKVVKIRFFFRRRHRNGALSMKIGQRLIYPQYCPFCGDKILKDNDEDI